MPMSKQDYKFFGVLYPDAENYDCQAERLNGYFDSSREFCVDEYEVNV